MGVENRLTVAKLEEGWEKHEVGGWHWQRICAQALTPISLFATPWSVCQLLYIEWINNKVLLGSTENYTRYPVINHNGK